MSKKQWHWGERDTKREREREEGREWVGEREIERDRERERERDIETGKDMHSIIVSTGYIDPGAQYFHGILVEKYIDFIMWQCGTKCPPHIKSKTKCCSLMELLGTSLFFYDFTFSGKVWVTVNAECLTKNKKRKIKHTIKKKKKKTAFKSNLESLSC